MNWEKYPHLFANGKFEFTTDGLDEFWLNDGYFYDEDGAIFTEKGYQPDSKVIPFEDCKLIARPISDMSDEEVISHQGDLFSDGDFIDDHRNAIKNRANKGFLSFKEALNFISIGVYPFDDDTDVIWRYENK